MRMRVVILKCRLTVTRPINRLNRWLVAKLMGSVGRVRGAVVNLLSLALNFERTYTRE